MASSQTPLRSKPDKFNPEEKEYEQNFDFDNHPVLNNPHPDEEANIKRARLQPDIAQSEQAAADAAEESNQQVNNAPAIESETNPDLPTIPTNFSRSNKPKIKLPGMSKALRWGLWGGGGLITTVVIVSSYFVGQMLDLTKAGHSNSKSGKHQSAQLSTRQRKLQQRIYTIKECRFAAIICKTSKGISPKEIAAYQEKGLLPTDPEELKKAIDIDAQGRAKVNYLLKTDDKGVVKQVHEADFAAELLDKTNPTWAADATGGFSRFAAWKARAPTTLKLLVERWKINLRAPFKGKTERQAIKEEFYKKFYGLNVDDPAAQAVDQETKDQAKAAVDQALKDGTVPSYPDPKALDGVSASDALSKVSGSRFLSGIGNALGTGCGIAQEFRTSEFTAWNLKRKALITFALMFFNEFDSVRAGHGNSEQLAFVMSMLLLTPNKEGKSFAHSNFVQNFVLGQPINRDGDLDKMSLTKPGSDSSTWTTVSNLLSPANRTTCNATLQFAIGATTIAGILFTRGLSAGAKAIEVAKLVAASGALAYALAWLDQIIQPILVRALVGTAPSTTEGGKLAGEGMFVGAGSLTETSGWTFGLHPNSPSQAYESMLAARPAMDSMTAAEHLHTSPFAVDQVGSITNQLAWKVLPYATSPISSSTFQNLASMIVSPLSLVTSSASSLLMHKTRADSAADMQDACPHENYDQMGLASTDCNNLIMGLTATEQEMDPDGKFTKDGKTPVKNSQGIEDNQECINDDGGMKQECKVLSDGALVYLIQQGQLNGKTGLAKNDKKLQKYEDTCMKEPPYLVPDHGGADFNDDLDTSVCTDNSDEMAHIHDWIVDGELYESSKLDDSNTLGTTTQSEIY